ncbi:MAG: pyridoxamine 5'-phosphate oxidase family protein [Myxococcales bacterium]|nr:pyridoxamine 5'-phosphate oxidase family protein [Myxococcales bacterium]
MLPASIDDPVQLLVEDRARAAECGDPMQGFATLATVEGGQPAARVVTLRRLTATQLLVSANATSPKVRALGDNPRCELLVYWVTLQRQYRVRGTARFVPARAHADLYALSPWRSKTWDHVYEQIAQSTPADRSDFVPRFREVLATLQAHYEEPGQVPATPHAGYLQVHPDQIEVQALDLEERLHDRRRFVRTTDDDWSEQALLP